MARGGEHIAQDPGDPLRFLIDLLFTEPKNLKPPRPQLEIASAIVPKGLAASVVAVAIGLDGEATVAPEKVDLVAPNANVDLRLGKSVSLADPQEVALQIAAGALSADILAKRQPKHASLPNRTAPLLLGDYAAKIRNRSRGSRNRDAPATSHLALQGK
jgi:hypothetical protein